MARLRHMRRTSGIRVVRLAPIALAAVLAFAHHVDARVASGPPSTEPDVAGVDAVPAPVTVDVFRRTVASILLPAGDLFAPLSAFGIEGPKGVLAPDGASGLAFEMGIDGFPGAPAASFEAVTWLAAALPAADVLSFYRTALAASGLVLDLDDVYEFGDATAYSLGFNLPGDVAEGTRLSVSVFDYGDPDLDFFTVRLAGVMEPDVSGLAAWVAGLPMIEQSEGLERLSVEAGSDPADFAIAVGAEFGFAITGRELEAQFASSLEDSMYTIDPDAVQRPQSYPLLGSDLDELEIVVNRLGGPGRLIVRGTIDLPG